MKTGEVLGEVSAAHYMAITSLDLSGDMIITGGKDCKVKAWMIADLLKPDLQ